MDQFDGGGSDLWNRVQAVLAENRVERKLRSDAASPSLLAGLARDEDGIPLTPTHATKKGRRYRYYVSHDLIAGRRVDGDPDEPKHRRGSARRIPAADLEAIVEGRIATFLADAAAVDLIVTPRAKDVEERRLLVARTGDVARSWPELAPADKAAILHRVIRTITVTATTVDIDLGADAVVSLIRRPLDRLGKLTPAKERVVRAEDGETITLSVPATLKRVGMEMRHLVDAPDARRARKPDRSLLRLLARAHRFRELILRGDGRSIVELAEESGVGAPYFGRILRLGFLAPEVTAAILDGRQPIDLSAKRLAVTTDLPKAWDEQKRMLGFG